MFPIYNILSIFIHRIVYLKKKKKNTNSPSYILGSRLNGRPQNVSLRRKTVKIQIEVVAISTEEEGFTEVRLSPALKSGLLQAPRMALPLRSCTWQTELHPNKHSLTLYYAHLMPGTLSRAKVIAHFLSRKDRQRESRGIENRNGDAALSAGTKQPEATVSLSLLCAVRRSL